MKISFDFDSTLGEDRIQRLAKVMIDNGNDVWITTSRMDEEHGGPNWNREVFAVAKKLEIPREKIRFTNGADKWLFLNGFDIHFDDDQIEIELMEENACNCVGVLIKDFDIYKHL